ncbi:hypothetical protein [Actinoplanes sp. NPDC049599]|uniref:hypothetical protein n=1 Tax=Actinoplanes sp. NPDC049599 TaxID=3363903 RepID=UPI003798DE29
MRSGSPTGTLLGTVTVPVIGSWETFQSVTTTLIGSASGPCPGVHRHGHRVPVISGCARVLVPDSRLDPRTPAEHPGKRSLTAVRNVVGAPTTGSYDEAR